MSSIWSRLAAFILKHSLRLIAGTVVLAVFFGYWALQVETDHGGGHFLSSDSPEYIAEAEVEERFGSNQTLLYLIFPSADPSDPDFLGRLAQFTQEANEYEGVEYVLSLANAPYLVREADSLAVRSLYDAELSGSQQVTRVQQQPFLRDLLITEDGTQPAMVIKIDPVFNDTAERITLSDQIRTRAEAVVGEVALAGAPFMRSEYAKRITREMPMLTSLALLLSAFFLFLAFRSFRAILLPLVIVTFGFSWTLALIALSGHKTNVVTSILPALIVVIGIANAIHISTKFFSLYERLGNKRRALVGTIETVGVATFLTCLTTAVGFFALTLSGSDQLGDFGMFASAGIMILYGLSIILIPATFCLTSPPAARTLAASNNERFHRLFAGLARYCRRNARPILVGAAVLLGLSLIGLMRVPTNVQVFTDFDPDDPVRQNIAKFDSAYGGLLPMDVVVKGDRAGLFRALPNLRRLDRLQNTLAELPDIERVYSLANVAKLTTQAYIGGGNPRAYRLPSQFELPALQRALRQLDGRSDGFENVPAFVDTSYAETRLLLGVNDIGTNRMLVLRDSVRAAIERVFPPDRYEAVVTGQAITSSFSNTNLVRNLVFSLALALLVISVLMALLFRSIPLTLISLAPNVLPLLLVGGVMGYLEIPLKPSTALIFPIAFGIAVDDTIHFLAKYRMLRLNGLNVPDAIHVTLRETGKAILFTSMVLVSGFLVFTASTFAGTANMGGLTALSLILALLTNLILLPALLYLFGERHVVSGGGSKPVSDFL